MTPQRAFEADPNPQSARAFLTALARERGEEVAALLRLADGPSSEFGRLCWACESLPDDGQRPLIWEAVSLLIEEWPDEARVIFPRHARALAEADGVVPAPLLRCYESGLGEGIEAHDDARLFAALPGLTTVEVFNRELVAALPEGVVDLSLPGSGLAVACARALPRLRRLSVSAFPADEDVAALLSQARWREGVTELRWSQSWRATEQPLPALPWPALERLSLAALHWPEAPLAELFPALRDLQITGRAPYVVSRAFPSIAGLELERFELAHCGHSELEALGPLASQVTSLSLSLPISPETLGQLTRLEQLQLQVLVPEDDELGAVFQVASELPLRSLSVHDVSGRASLEDVFGCGFPRIASLSLNSPRGLRGDEARVLRNACPALEGVELMADEALLEVVEALRDVGLLQLRCDARDATRLVDPPPAGLRLHLHGSLSEVAALSASPLREQVASIHLRDIDEDPISSLSALAELPWPRLTGLRIWDIDEPTLRAVARRFWAAPSCPRLASVSRS